MEEVDAQTNVALPDRNNVILPPAIKSARIIIMMVALNGVHQKVAVEAIHAVTEIVVAAILVETGFVALQLGKIHPIVVRIAVPVVIMMAYANQEKIPAIAVRIVEVVETVFVALQLGKIHPIAAKTAVPAVTEYVVLRREKIPAIVLLIADLARQAKLNPAEIVELKLALLQEPGGLALERVPVHLVRIKLAAIAEAKLALAHAHGVLALDKEFAHRVRVKLAEIAVLKLVQVLAVGEPAQAREFVHQDKRNHAEIVEAKLVQVLVPGVPAQAREFVHQDKRNHAEIVEHKPAVLLALGRLALKEILQTLTNLITASQKLYLLFQMQLVITIIF